MKKLLGSLLLVTCLLGSSEVGFAQETTENPIEKQVYQSENDFDIPTPEENPQFYERPQGRATLPEKFDYTFGDFETSVKNQKTYGLCWAFVATDVIAISSKKEFGKEILPAPNYFNYYFADNAFSDAENPYSRGNRPLDGGGNAGPVFSQGALGNLGVLDEYFSLPLIPSVFPPLPLQTFNELPRIDAQLEKVIHIPALSYLKLTEENRSKKIYAMKEALFAYGALSSYYDTEYLSTYYNEEPHSFYTPEEDILSGAVRDRDGQWVNSTHELTIVGWDDNYSKENFVKTPKNDGAFLIKNSYGPTVHDGGYFHMSYEDIYMLGADNSAVDVIPTTYDNQYNYVSDTGRNSFNVSNRAKQFYLANTYQTSNQGELLKAVSLETNSPGIEYEIYYLEEELVKNKNVSLNDRMTSLATGIIEHQGTELVQVTEQKIPANTPYTIITKYKYPDSSDYYSVGVQAVNKGTGQERPLAEAGKSYFSSTDNPNTQNWKNLSDGSYAGWRCNLWLNAYTDDIEVERVTVTPASSQITVGEQLNLTAVVTPEDASSELQWSSSDETVASVDEHGLVTALSTGSVTITAQSTNRKSGTAQLQVKDNRNYFGTTPWKWEDATQTITFGGGKFPESTLSKSVTIQNEIGKHVILNGKTIKKIVFTEPVELSKNSVRLFSYLPELIAVEGANYLNLSNAVSLEQLFIGCSKLTEIDTSTWTINNATNLSGMFAYNSSLRTIDVSKWDTSKVTDLSKLFMWSVSLEEVDTSNWNTSQVTNMSNVFRDAKKLKEAKVANWDTSKVTTMQEMFYAANAMVKADVSKWDTSQVTIMQSMFRDNKLLKELDVSNWNVEKVTNMNYMFFEALSLKKLDFTNWNTTQVKSMDRFIYYGTLLDTLVLGKEMRFKNELDMGTLTEEPYTDKWLYGENISSAIVVSETTKELNTVLTSYNGEKAGVYRREKGQGYFGTVPWTWEDTTQTLTFYDGQFPESTLSKSVTIQNEIEKHTALNGQSIKRIVFTEPVDFSKNSVKLFAQLLELTSVEGASYLNLSTAVSLEQLFIGCSKLTEIDTSTWAITNATNLSGMFAYNSSLRTIDVSKWDTSKVTNLSKLFMWSVSLEEVDTSNWDTSQVTNMSNVFRDTKKLKEAKVANWDTSKVTNMQEMFYAANAMVKADVSKWDTSQVTIMQSMFRDNKLLKELDVSKWNVEKVTNMNYMFFEALSLKTLDFTNWNTTQVKSMDRFIYYGTLLDTLIIGENMRFKHSIDLGTTSNEPYTNRWLCNDGNKETVFETTNALNSFLISPTEGKVGIYIREK